MSVNQEVSKLWHQLSADSYKLASLEELKLSSAQKSTLINSITQTARQLKYLQSQPSYDGTMFLRLPNGSQVMANIAIFGAMNFLAEMESELGLDFKLKEKVTFKPDSSRPTITKNRNTDIGGILGGLAVGSFSMWALISSLMAFINSSTGKVDVATGLTLGIILLAASLAGFFFTYILFTNK